MDDPGSQRAPCEHWRLPVPSGARAAGLDAERVRRFDTHRVEGLARLDGDWLYTVDAEQALTLLLPEGQAARR